MTAVLLALLTAVVWGQANYLGPLLCRTHPARRGPGRGTVTVATSSAVRLVSTAVAAPSCAAAANCCSASR